MIELSIIVVSYETADLLVECLDALLSARRAHPDFAFEVIVVDNGSRDGSVERAAGHPTSPRLVAGLRNRGFAAAVNTGLLLRRGRHVLLLNSDVRIEQDLLVRGVALLDENEDIGVLGPSLVHPDGRPQRSVHRPPGLGNELLPAWIPVPGAGPHPSKRTAGLRGSSALQDVEAIRGAVFFIRGLLFEKVGFFDEGYFFFLEETDYCKRARLAGHRVAYCASLRATHRLGASSKQRAPLATRIEYHRSLYRFLNRQQGPWATAVVKVWRSLRNAFTVVLLGPPAVLIPAIRRRWAERAGLLLWHLRGCPAEPRLADVLRRLPPPATDSPRVTG